MSYPTVDEVRSHLELTTTLYDVKLTQIMDWTEALIHAYIGRNLNSDTYTEKRFKPNSGQIQLTNYPVASITSIDFDGDSKDLTEYDVDEDNGILHGTFTNVKKVTIVYVAGFTVLPKPIEDVFYNIVSDRFDDYQTGDTADVSDVTLFDFAKVSYDTSTSPNARTLSYSGVESKGHVPDSLQNYLGVLDMYKSNFVLVGLDGY